MNREQISAVLHRVRRSAEALEQQGTRGPLDLDDVRNAVVETARSLVEIADVLDAMNHAPLRGS